MFIFLDFYKPFLFLCFLNKIVNSRIQMLYRFSTVFKYSDNDGLYNEESNTKVITYYLIVSLHLSRALLLFALRSARTVLLNALSRDIVEIHLFHIFPIIFSQFPHISFVISSMQNNGIPSLIY